MYNTIKVTSNAYMLVPNNFANIFNIISNLQRRSLFCALKVDYYHDAAVGYGSKEDVI